MSPSPSRDLETFLSKHRIIPGDDYSHTSMKGGSFYIPYDKTAEFHNLYYEHIKKGGAAYLTEKHKHISPILIDLDFRYANTDAKRVYTADQVKDLTTAYLRVLNEYVDLSHDPTIYILEKPSPKLHDKDPAIVKDGVHMMIPDVVTTPELQFTVRNRVLELGVIDRVFKDCGFTNTAADIFDEQVIQKNNWLMHGSCKPKGTPYEVSQTFTLDVSEHTLNVAESKLTGVELIKELSIRNKPTKTAIKADKVDEIAAIESDAMEAERAKIKAIHDKIQAYDDDDTTQPQAYSKINIGEFMEHIHIKYCDSYSDWFRIGAALVNSGFSYEVFDTFSKRSDKYDYKSAQKLWNDFERSTNKTITFGSLMYYLKQSDFEYFRQVQKQLKLSEKDGIRPDEKHAKNILSFCEIFFCKSLGVIMYDDRDGLWTNCEKRHINIIQRLTHQIFPTDKESKAQTGFLQLFNPAYRLATAMCPDIENLNVSKYKGFLLFNNGVLDFKNYEMLPKSPHYNFLDKIDRDYTCGDYSNLEDEIMTKLFDMPFTDTEKRDYFIQQIARGMAGHTEDRQFVFATGDTACGKGTLTKLLNNTFTNYVTVFNNHHLVAKAGNQESELKWKWILDIWYKRMAICNEFDMNIEDTGNVNKFGAKLKTIQCIDGTTMKTLVSNGDTISCRGLYKDPIKVSNCAFIMVLANDTPSVKPCDAAYLNRANCIHFDRSSSEDCDVADELYFLKDESINEFIENRDVFDAFISLLSKYYNMNKLAKPESVIQESKERSGAGDCGLSWLNEYYELLPKGQTLATLNGGYDWEEIDKSHGKIPYYTPFEYIYQKYITHGNVDSKINVGKMLKNMGCKAANKKINGKSTRVYVGIRSVYKTKCDIVVEVKDEV